MRCRLLLLVLIAGVGCAEAQAQKPYRLPDLGERFKDRVIWGSQAESPDGFTLAFGGQDQVSDDGLGHTRFKHKDGEWTELNSKADQQKAWSAEQVCNAHWMDTAFC